MAREPLGANSPYVWRQKLFLILADPSRSVVRLADMLIFVPTVPYRGPLTLVVVCD